jgi:hypothetical protein
MRKFTPYLIKFSIALMVFSLISQQVSATKGDVERALELLKQARAAIGGDAAIGSVQSLSISGKSRRQLQLPERGARELNGEFELNMLLPDKLMRIEKLSIGSPEGADRAQGDDAQAFKIKDRRVKIIRGDMEAPEAAEKAMQQHEQAELARYMLGLLLTPPPSFKATYNYLGEGDIEGTRAEIIEAQSAGGFVMKIYLDKSSHLPLMMSYQGTELPRLPFGEGVRVIGTAGAAGEAGEDKDVIIIRHEKKEGAAGEELPRIIYERKGGENAPADGAKFTRPLPPPENALIEVRFSDFRAEGGVMLPHTFTQVVNGQVETVWTVESYLINSPATNEKFQKDMLFKTREN